MAKKRQPKRLLWFLAFVVVLLFLGAFVTYGVWAQTFNMKDVDNMPELSAAYDVDGKFYTRLRGEDRIIVPLSEVSKHFVQALLAREDTRFYKHHGVDPWGIVRAIARNITHMSVREGASTITQQLARNSFRLGGHNLHRKVLEAFVAARIERNYSKDDILGCYVNRIYFGSGFYGVETASRAYFNKHASQLNLPESAMLVGLIRSPNRFSPFNNLKAAIAQKDAVLTRMEGLEMITRADADKAINSRVAISRKPPLTPQQNYALDAVRDELNIILSNDQIKEGGLRVYTSLDPVLQKAAGDAVEAQLHKIELRPGYPHPRKPQSSPEEGYGMATTYLQGAVVVIDNHTGGISALVGGRDYGDSKLDRAFSLRQVGSTFKPFVYAAAFQRGLLPGATIDDSPLRAGEIHGAGAWNPSNSDGLNKGTLRAEEGLIQSRNTMSARVGNLAGMDAVRKLAGEAGITDIPKVPAIYLGAFEGKLRDLTAAYTVFPNDGVRNQPYLIERIDDADGQVIYQAAHITTTPLDPGVSWLISSTLQKVLQRGTAAAARSLGFNKTAAGKTGTTNDFKDAWFVGYTKSLTCGVWVGFDQPVTIMPKGYGSALALPIWVQVMNAAPAQRYPASALACSEPLQRVNVCSESSELATTGCQNARADYQIDLPQSLVPKAYCRVHNGGEAGTESRPAGSQPNVPQKILHSFWHFFGH